MSQDVLEDFLFKWLKERPFRPPFSPTVVTFDDGVTGTTIYREGQFQVQLFAVAPNTEIVDHVHPNVDSYEVYLGGNIVFRHNGIERTTWDEIHEKNGMASTFGYFLRVKPNDWHGATIGGMGGTFLSVQHWINNVRPSSVHLDWTFQNKEDKARNLCGKQ